MLLAKLHESAYGNWVLEKLQSPIYQRSRNVPIVPLVALIKLQLNFANDCFDGLLKPFCILRKK